MPAASSPIVGIDLGTTFSAVAHFVDGDVRFINNALGDRLTPSVVAQDPRSGNLVVGRAARDIMIAHPERAVARFKRGMGTDTSFELAGRTLSAVDLSAYVLDSLRTDAERELGCEVRRCVVTVPAYFSEAQRVATRRAAEAVGMSVERIINEPTAAAISYGMHQGDAEHSFLVFDLGGGTFDVSIMELFEGLLQVRSVAGESNLGGEDFTDALVASLIERAGGDPEAARQADPDSWAMLFKRAEMLKRKLSRWPAAEVTVPAFSGTKLGETRLEVQAADADRAYRPLLDRLLGPCRAALRGANLSTDELTDVLLVGGATRMPAVRAFAQEVFGREARSHDDPDIAVARGAAVQAALCNDDEAVADIVVTDVLSHSLGVDVVRHIGNRLVDGYFSPIIHRNTVIPTSRTETFSTVEDNQQHVLFNVYEGESRKVSDNRRLGELKVKGIPKGPKGQEVEVTFTYDLDGILGIDAKVVSTGKKFATVLKRDGKQLGASEFERARSRLASIRADPKERPRYRDLLARADLLWREVDAERRPFLQRAIEHFEGALATHTPKVMEDAYLALSSVCDQFDDGERW